MHMIVVAVEEAVGGEGAKGGGVEGDAGEEGLKGFSPLGILAFSL